MKEYRLTDWLPTTKKEMEIRGWDSVDVILFSGDAYVDHPSFGAAVIGRTLESAGYKVAIVPQPDWHGDFRDFKKLGRPILWSTSTQQASVCVRRMPTVLTVVTTAVRNILPLYILRF